MLIWDGPAHGVAATIFTPDLPQRVNGRPCGDNQPKISRRVPNLTRQVSPHTPDSESRNGETGVACNSQLRPSPAAARSLNVIFQFPAGVGICDLLGSAQKCLNFARQFWRVDLSCPAEMI